MVDGTFLQYGTPVKFGPERLARLKQANTIIAEYESEGYSLTLRQLHYQFVARDLYPNTLASYNMLKHLISDGRMAGLVSWTAIEDRGRNLMGLRYEKGVKSAIAALREEYKKDLWEDQPFRVEVWIEKQALEGVISPICDKLRVNYFATKGYNSQSEQWRAGQRLAGYYQRGQRPIILHLGDHDPSGIDMTRDNRERLEAFVGVPVEVIRLALNMEQIERYSPPPNFAKESDSRFADYAAKYGDESWELDALSPDLLRELIRDGVERFKDPTKWAASLEAEAEDLNDLDVILEEMGE